MYSAYVLLSQTTGRIYVGQTCDLVKRLKQHNDRGFDKKAYTKLSGDIWKIVYTEEFNTRKEVLKREKELKSSQGRNFIKNKILRSGSSMVEQ